MEAVTNPEISLQISSARGNSEEFNKETLFSKRFFNPLLNDPLLVVSYFSM